MGDVTRKTGDKRTRTEHENPEAVLQQFRGSFAQQLEELDSVYLPGMLVGDRVPLTQRHFIGASVSDGEEHGVIIGVFPEEVRAENTGIVSSRSKADDLEMPIEFVAQVGSRKYLVQLEDMSGYLVDKKLDLSTIKSCQKQSSAVVALTKVKKGGFDTGSTLSAMPMHLRE
jgi:hypothetical protein